MIKKERVVKRKDERKRERERQRESGRIEKVKLKKNIESKITNMKMVGEIGDKTLIK